MPEKDPIGGDARRRRRSRRVPPEAACSICGVRNPEALVEGGLSLIEGHHVVGEANDAGLRAWVCRNHHAMLHERLREVGVDLERDAAPNVLERIIGIFRALGAFFAALAEHLLGWAEEIAALVRRLDLDHVGWQDTGEASA